MTHARRIAVLVPAFALASLGVLATACTSEDQTARPSQSPTPTDGIVSRDTGGTDFLPGRFVYQFNSITAIATFRGNVATLNVRNGTGSEIGPPALTVIGIDDLRYEGQVDGDAAVIPDGEQVSIEISFPDAVGPETIGLAVLTFGDDNVGAMAPMPRPDA